MEELKNHLYLDNAVAGEAAGIALGLVAAGSATERATEILAYAHDTQHEKVSHYPHKCNWLYSLDGFWKSHQRTSHSTGGYRTILLSAMN